MKPSRLLHLALPALAALLAAAPRLPAQTAPTASSAPSAADKDIVQLSVFEVNAEADDEYRAANTTTGTRYNTPIKDLPMNIEVLTPPSCATSAPSMSATPSNTSAASSSTPPPVASTAPATTPRTPPPHPRHFRRR
jgi:hypothetical protein